MNHIDKVYTTVWLAGESNHEVVSSNIGDLTNMQKGDRFYVAHKNDRLVQGIYEVMARHWGWRGERFLNLDIYISKVIEL